MRVKTTLPGNNHVPPLELEGEVIGGDKHRYSNDNRTVACFDVRAKFPVEYTERLRARGLPAFLDYEDEGRTRMVATKIMVPASDCEIVDDGTVTLKELTRLEAEGYEARNSKRLWFQKEMKSLKQDLQRQ